MHPVHRYLIAPDSFKGTLSSEAICDLVEQVILKQDPTAVVTKFPVADGGEGLVEAFLHHFGGTRYTLTVTGPLFKSVEASWAMLNDQTTAVIEMAAAAGLPLLANSELNPEKTTTFGFGELILDALHHGAKKIILGLGGSSTNDGGIGMASALGYRFIDQDGIERSPVGESLGHISRIVAASINLTDVTFEAACDVANPLYGLTGAAHVFAPQKGADLAMVERLDQGLRNLARVIASDLNLKVDNLRGGGAAGGLGAGSVAFLGATLKSGIDLLLDAADFDQLLAQQDIVITGEGRMDGQSLQGKTPVGIARRAKKQNVPVIGLAGSLGRNLDPLYEEGFTALFASVIDSAPLEEALKNGPDDLKALAENVIRLIQKYAFRLHQT